MSQSESQDGQTARLRKQVRQALLCRGWKAGKVELSISGHPPCGCIGASVVPYDSDPTPASPIYVLSQGSLELRHRQCGKVVLRLEQEDLPLAMRPKMPSPGRKSREGGYFVREIC